MKPSLQIKRQLLRGILDGQFEPNHTLPTIQTLARTFQVSTRTVQKAIAALTEEGIIEPKRRVGLIIKPLQLHAGRGRRIGLVYARPPESMNGSPYPKLVLDGLRAGLQQAGYTLVDCPLADLDRLVLVESLLKQRLSGMILFEMDSDIVIFELRELRLPMISMDYDASRHGVPSVIFNNVRGMVQATNVLIKHGHREIVLMRPLAKTLFLHNNQSLDWVDEERLKGYWLAMEEAGLKPIVREFELNIHALRAVLLDLLGRKPAPTAFVCLAGWSADIIAREAERLGYRIPQDLSIAAIGTRTEMANGQALTMAEVDVGGMGENAAVLMLEAMKVGSGGRARRVVLPTALTSLETVAAAPRLDVAPALAN